MTPLTAIQKSFTGARVKRFSTQASLIFNYWSISIIGQMWSWQVYWYSHWASENPNEIWWITSLRSCVVSGWVWAVPNPWVYRFTFCLSPLSPSRSLFAADIRCSFLAEGAHSNPFLTLISCVDPMKLTRFWSRPWLTRWQPGIKTENDILHILYCQPTLA